MRPATRIVELAKSVILYDWAEILLKKFDTVSLNLTNIFIT